MSRPLLNAEQLAEELFSRLNLEKSTDFYLALSGGQDSCVLLDLMYRVAQLQPKNKPLSLTLLHFDHAFQSQSKSWTRHCENLAKQYELPIATKRYAVQIDPKKGLEASARLARYFWFEKEIANRQCLTKSSQNAAVLLTAHHANDQAETLLINLMRGTGVSGLRGIARKKIHSIYTLVRPLLDFDQQQIAGYAQQHDLKWIDDPSNQEQKIRRNAIRAQVLPALSAIKHDAVKQFVKSADHMVVTDHLLADLAKLDLQTVQQCPYCPLDQSYGINLQDLQKLGDTFGLERQSNALRYWLQQCGYALNSQQNFQQLLDWSNGGAGERSELRNGDRVYRVYRHTLFVTPFLLPKSSLSEAIWQDLSIPLTITIGDRVYEVHCQVEDKARKYSAVKIVFADEARQQFSLKKRFQSAAIPHWRRNITPILVKDDKIIGMVFSEKDTWLIVS